MQACLGSVAGWGDELIVVDSYITDRTAVISRERTNKVYQLDFHGFGRLRSEAVALTTHAGCSSGQRRTDNAESKVEIL